MVKNSKRKQDLKSKLIAAIAMLMVATIMMVSSTYAWFTLSTAPEVQGISTNVGSNGNLEIALSPNTGDEADVTDGNTNNDWAVKNLTWGNQLNLAGLYGLEDIELFPARLNANDLLNAPLSTPVYGADGRIDKLEANTQIGGKVDGKNGWIVADDIYGVRVVGTSSSQSEYQITFNQQYANLGTYYKGVLEKAQSGLNANGSALAEMAIKHANADSPDANEYKGYIPALTALVGSLTEANNDLEQAIRASIYAIASSNLLLYDPDLVADPANPTDEELEELAGMYNTIKGLMEAPNTLDVIWGNTVLQNALTAIESVYPLDLDEAYNVWTANNTKLAEATATLTTISGYDTVKWADDGEIKGVSSIVGILMNANDNMTINGYKLSEFKAKAMAALDEPKREDYGTDEEFDTAYSKYEEAVDFVSSLQGNVNLQMGNGTGIYADLAGLVGNIHAAVSNVMISVPIGGKTVSLKVQANIDTVTGNSPVFVSVRTTLAQIGYLNVDSSTEAVIDNVYGYIVDFLFRTNASGSKLQLQTEAKDRIYGEDGNNANTMGGGSTMTFTSDALNQQAVMGLMSAMRIVFFDTITGEVLGTAKLDQASITSEVNAETGKTEITADLYLYDGDVKTSNELCDLPTNTAKAVSALVYMDGENITNADVAATAQSMTGSMNLQFSSSAELIPMENSALLNGESNATEAPTEAPTQAPTEAPTETP